MRFTRLRLSGFKSFVDPTEFLIESGLTGIVGPNGCGKSNLLEALRWVMGATSAKAMRGEGMDDVIFAGSGARPARRHAEVTLTIDNADRTAPAEFNDQPMLEVVRRIDRGEGSSYRINGAEARARDVQRLFADASTGANSPALVRQGQINELIAAKPQNRRRILEEAAGISGLHSRRHEAELRVRGAEANLARLDDLADELRAGLARLRREARVAARYRMLSSEIRALRAALLLARWREAREALARARTEEAAAAERARLAAQAAAAAATAALAAEAALPPLREEATVAAAVLHRLEIEQDRLQRAREAAVLEAHRLAAQTDRLQAALEREAQIADDAGHALARLQAETARLQAEVAAAPARGPDLERRAQAAEAARATAEAAVEALATRAAAGAVERRAAQLRAQEAEARYARAREALAQAVAEQAALPTPADAALAEERTRLEAAERQRAAAREALAEAEIQRARAARDEEAARAAARVSEDSLAAAAAERRGLARLNTPVGRGGWPAVLEQLSAAPGLEAALAAALGDEVTAALDPRAPVFWAGRDAPVPTWPDGVVPLAPLVEAPLALAARLAFTGLVDRAEGARLQPRLPIGARLVSREGDLWRWDGYTADHAAPRPAQARLEQKARLVALGEEIGRLEPAAAEARARQAAARAAVAAADQALAAARAAPRAIEARLEAARQAVDRLRDTVTRRDARAQALAADVARLTQEAADTESARAASLADLAATPDPREAPQGLESARAEAVRARETAARARAELDSESRIAAARLRRLRGLADETADWSRRAQAAAAHAATLERDLATARTAQADSRDAPARAEAESLRLAEALETARARRRRADDALAGAEAGRAETDRAGRAADAAAADAREARAAAFARLEAAGERLAAQAQAVEEATSLSPEALAESLAADAVALPAEAEGAEKHLAALERDRDALGAVNLVAEAQAEAVATRLDAMAAERADLSGALGRLRSAIAQLNDEGRDRLTAAFAVIAEHFRGLFTTLFEGGQAELRLVESEDPLEAGLEIYACPPGKRLAVMSLMSGGEQALTAVALIFAVFLANPAPICVLDEVDAPLDDANVERFCDLLQEMRRRAPTRFVTITHNPLTMSRMDRLFGVTMRERGVSQLVSVDLNQAAALVAQI